MSLPHPRWKDRRSWQNLPFGGPRGIPGLWPGRIPSFRAQRGSGSRVTVSYLAARPNLVLWKAAATFHPLFVPISLFQDLLTLSTQSAAKMLSASSSHCVLSRLSLSGSLAWLSSPKSTRDVLGQALLLALRVRPCRRPSLSWPSVSSPSLSSPVEPCLGSREGLVIEGGLSCNEEEWRGGVCSILGPHRLSPSIASCRFLNLSHAADSIQAVCTPFQPHLKIYPKACCLLFLYSLLFHISSLNKLAPNSCILD